MCEKTNYKGTSNTQIDKCMRELIKYLRSCGIKTVSCCCGHGKYPMTIVVKHYDCRWLGRDIFSGKVIPRSRNFYKRDGEGYYYIPETIEDEFDISLCKSCGCMTRTIKSKCGKCKEAKT